MSFKNFQDLIDRVEQSNIELVKIRDTIETEAIDLGSSIIDVMRESLVANAIREEVTGTDTLQSEERYREDRRLQVDQTTALVGLKETIDKIYQLMLDQQTDENPLEDLIPPVAVGPRLGGMANTPKGGKRGGKFGFMPDIAGFFKGLLGRVLKGGIALLIANEVMSFFGVSLKDVGNYIEEKINTLEFPELSLSNIGTTLDANIMKALDIAFQGEGIGSGVESAVTGAAIGYMIGGPYGGLIGAALGFVAGYFSSEDAKELYGDLKRESKQIIDQVTNFFKGAYDFLTGDPTTWEKLRAGMEKSADEIDFSGSQIDPSDPGFESFNDPSSVNKYGGFDTLEEQGYNIALNELKNAIEELNNRGENLKSARQIAIQVEKDKQNLDSVDFQKKYNFGKRRADEYIRQNLEIARRNYEDAQEEVVRERYQYDVRRDNYLATSNDDNSVNIQTVIGSGYERVQEPKSFDD